MNNFHFCYNISLSLIKLFFLAGSAKDCSRLSTMDPFPRPTMIIPQLRLRTRTRMRLLPMMGKTNEGWDYVSWVHHLLTVLLSFYVGNLLYVFISPAVGMPEFISKCSSHCCLDFHLLVVGRGGAWFLPAVPKFYTTKWFMIHGFN